MEKEEKKIELECDYCGVAIKETDIKCPNCGANCSQKIKNYKKQKEKEEEEIRRKNSEALSKSFDAPVRVIIPVGIVFFAILFIMIIVGISRASKAVNDLEEEGIVCKQDSYELYSYVSDKFPSQYNTPEGYQKIAFHVVCENKGKSSDSLNGFEVKLTADDYAVNFADLKVDIFERVEEGKEEYPQIMYNEIGPGEKLQGYVGFLVPKDKKVLKLTIDGKTTTLDNPVYEGE